MNISIIIPTINESERIGRLIERLLTADRSKIELIVVDGGSTDNTVQLAFDMGATIVHCSCSRAKQMNEGARAAQYDLLYFVHADTLPPIGFYDDLRKQFELGCDAACYTSKFEHKPFMLRLNEFFSQFYWLVSRGGDQSLFIKRSVFEDYGGYDESMVIMEEYPLIEKLMANKQLSVIPKPILISSRKYSDRSWLKVSRANYAAFKMYKKGEDSLHIKKRYLELLG